jgi:plastin-1
MARAPGIVIVNASPSDIIAIKKEQVLGVIWQIVRAHLLCHLSVKNCEELILLMEDDEPLELFVMTKQETLLTRWINYHLKRSHFQKRHPKVLRNIPKDLVDCEIKIMHMHQLFPETIDISQMDALFNTEHLMTRAHLVIEYFGFVSNDVQFVLEPVDIIEESLKLSVAFLCQLFDLQN